MASELMNSCLGGEMRLVDGVARRRRQQTNGVRLLVDGGGSPARRRRRLSGGVCVRLLVCVMPLLNASMPLRG
jgi:hypothetical protein